MTQEDSLRDLIADLAREQNPLSVSPSRLAGILEGLLGFSSGSAASVEENLRVALCLGSSGVKEITEEQAVLIVKSKFA